MKNEEKRLLPDGSIATDLPVNPKALERRERERLALLAAEKEGSLPWTRERLEAVLLKARVDTEKLNKSSAHAESPTRASACVSGADLSGLNLSGLDLSYANFHGANFEGADLSKCRLVRANLHGASFKGADLSGANAVEANLHGACLCSSKARGALFLGANLAEACFQGSEGVDVSDKPLTHAERQVAKARISEGFRVEISDDEGRVRYIGERMDKANVSGMSSSCRRK